MITGSPFSFLHLFLEQNLWQLMAQHVLALTWPSVLHPSVDSQWNEASLALYFVFHANMESYYICIHPISLRAKRASNHTKR